MEEDFEAYFRLKSDEKTMYYLQDIQLSSREEAEREFREVLADAASLDRKFYFLHMERKDTGEQVGSIGYTVRETAPQAGWPVSVRTIRQPSRLWTAFCGMGRNPRSRYTLQASHVVVWVGIFPRVWPRARITPRT